MRAAAALLVLLSVGLGSAGCGGAGGDGPLAIFAASSLREALPALDPAPEYHFGGSDRLAAQIRDGAQADLFASASPDVMQALYDDGLVEAPLAIASNRLVVVLPRTNPAGIRSLTDLARPGVKLVLGAEGVPIGDYARDALARAGLRDALDNVVSLEDDAKGVLAKVALGEADAGIVYATDATAADADVVALHVPQRVQPQIRYFAAIVTGTARHEQARSYLERLAGPSGRAALRRAGFLPPA